jgi:hypothetical protein
MISSLEDKYTNINLPSIVGGKKWEREIILSPHSKLAFPCLHTIHDNVS